MSRTGRGRAHRDAPDRDGGGEQQERACRLGGQEDPHAHGRGGEDPRPEPRRLAEEPVQAGLPGSRLAQRHDLCGQLRHQRLGCRRGPRKQYAQREVGERELQQEEQLAAGGDHQDRLQGEHEGRDHQQAGDGPRRHPANHGRQPDHGRRCDHPARTPGQGGADEVAGDRQAEGLGQAHDRRQQQPAWPGQLQVRARGGPSGEPDLVPPRAALTLAGAGRPGRLNCGSPGMPRAGAGLSQSAGGVSE